nr:hypothetical protein [Corynebacterium jeikeium]
MFINAPALAGTAPICSPLSTGLPANGAGVRIGSPRLTNAAALDCGPEGAGAEEATPDGADPAGATDWAVATPPIPDNATKDIAAATLALKPRRNPV